MGIPSTPGVGSEFPKKLLQTGSQNHVLKLCFYGAFPTSTCFAVCFLYSEGDISNWFLNTL